MHKNKFTKSFGVAGSGVGNSGSSGKNTGNNFYEGKFANEGVCNGFENICCKRFVFGAGKFNFFAVSIGCNFGSNFFCGGEDFFEFVEKHFDTAKSYGVAAIYGSDDACCNAFFEAAETFFFGEFFTIEEFFHEFVVCFSFFFNDD